MAKRSSSKPLYELMVGERDRSEGVPVRPDVEDDDGDEGELNEEPGRLVGGLSGGLSAGRSIRLPVGYIVLAVPTVLVLVVLAYMFGSARGEQRAQADSDRLLKELTGGDPAWTANDPLTGADPGTVRGEKGSPGPGTSGGVAGAVPGAVPGAVGTESSRAGDQRGDTGETATLPGGSDSASGVEGDGNRPDSERWPDIESDPRVKGRYYLVLAETRREGAMRLAAFLRERELEAYIVPGNNSGLRRVIVKPGFDSSSESDPDVARLREAVHRVGRAWKALYPVESDLSDAYLAPG